MKRTVTAIFFPSICATLGGAQGVTFNTRSATVTRADGSRVKVKLAQLPQRNRWTSFTLADAVAQSSVKHSNQNHSQP